MAHVLFGSFVFLQHPGPGLILFSFNVFPPMPHHFSLPCFFLYVMKIHVEFKIKMDIILYYQACKFFRFSLHSDFLQYFLKISVYFYRLFISFRLFSKYVFTPLLTVKTRGYPKMSPLCLFFLLTIRRTLFDFIWLLFFIGIGMF